MRVKELTFKITANKDIFKTDHIKKVKVARNVITDWTENDDHYVLGEYDYLYIAYLGIEKNDDDHTYNLNIINPETNEKYKVFTFDKSLPVDKLFYHERSMIDNFLDYSKIIDRFKIDKQTKINLNILQ